MFRFPKSFRLAAVAALFSLGSTLGLTGAAHAAGTSTSVIVARSSRVCLNPIYASSSVEAQGTASPGVKFTVNWSPNGGTYTDIYATGDYSQGFRAIFSTSFGNFPGPGYFKLCARNFSTTQSANVNMSITGY